MRTVVAVHKTIYCEENQQFHYALVSATFRFLTINFESYHVWKMAFNKAMQIIVGNILMTLKKRQDESAYLHSMEWVQHNK